MGFGVLILLRKWPQSTAGRGGHIWPGKVHFYEIILVLCDPPPHMFGRRIDGPPNFL